MVNQVRTGLSLRSAAGRLVLAATILGSGMAQLDATVVNIALPAMGRSLDAQVAGLQLVVTAYAVTLAALILIAGSLGDQLGRRRIFVIGVIWFATASLLCAVAPNVAALIAARTLQGIGGALLTPGSLAIIEASFKKSDRAPAIGAWSALVGVAGAVGPLLGGYLVETVSWRAIFVINLPLAAVVVWLTVRYVPESRNDQASGRIDYPGAAAATLGLAGATYAMIGGASQGLTPTVLFAGVVGAVGLVSFVIIQRRSRSPMLPLDIFASRQFTAANLVTFVVYAGLAGVLFLLVVMLQTSLGYSPVQAGAAALPVTVLMLLFSAQSGALAQRIGPRIPLTVGPLTLAVGMLMMLRIDVGTSYVGTVLPAVIVFGVGLTATVAPVTSTVLAAADERHAGVASAVNNSVARVAGLLAVALLPPIAGINGEAFTQPVALANGFHIAMIVSAGLAAAGGVLAFFSISNSILSESTDEGPADSHHHTHGSVTDPPPPWS